eukprot:5145106-Pleurochrysis_carterae.AAC.1
MTTAEATTTITSAAAKAAATATTRISTTSCRCPAPKAQREDAASSRSNAYHLVLHNNPSCSQCAMIDGAHSLIIQPK